MATVLEETTNKYTATIKDQDGTAVPSSSLDAMTLTVYNETSETIIRTTMDALNTNGVTVDANGLVTWTMRPYETKIVDLTINVEDTEDRVALFEYYYSSLSSGTMASNAFTTVSGESTVSVSHAAHGLAVDDNVVFIGVDDVGGLELDGLWLVSEITDPNTYVIRHRSAATSSETGGGTPEFYYNGKSGKHRLKFKVRRVDTV